LNILEDKKLNLMIQKIPFMCPNALHRVLVDVVRKKAGYKFFWFREFNFPEV